MYQKLFGDRSPPRPAKGEGLAAFPDHQLDLRVRPRAGRDKGKKREKGGRGSFVNSNFLEVGARLCMQSSVYNIIMSVINYKTE